MKPSGGRAKHTETIGRIPDSKLSVMIGPLILPGGISKSQAAGSLHPQWRGKLGAGKHCKRLSVGFQMAYFFSNDWLRHSLSHSSWSSA